MWHYLNLYVISKITFSYQKSKTEGRFLKAKGGQWPWAP